MARGGAVCLPLPEALVENDLLPGGGRTGHHPDLGGGHTGGPPFHDTIWDHTRPHSGGNLRSGAGLAGTIIRR